MSEEFDNDETELVHVQVPLLYLENWRQMLGSMLKPQVTYSNDQLEMAKSALKKCSYLATAMETDILGVLYKKDYESD